MILSGEIDVGHARGVEEAPARDGLAAVTARISAETFGVLIGVAVILDSGERPARAPRRPEIFAGAGEPGRRQTAGPGDGARRRENLR